MAAARPNDANQLAKLVVDMTTGQIPNDSFDKPKGRARSGIAAAKNMTPEQRRERAKKAAAARWQSKESPTAGRA